jgi:hypothetical protein
MDHRNKAIPADQITSFDVNKAIQRSTVKALALHGLGLNIYAGEDLPLVLPDMTVAEMNALIETAKTHGWNAQTAIGKAEMKKTVSDDMKREIIEKVGM